MNGTEEHFRHAYALLEGMRVCLALMAGLVVGQFTVLFAAAVDVRVSPRTFLLAISAIILGTSVVTWYLMGVIR